MARTVSALPRGGRVSDHATLGGLTNVVPASLIDAVLGQHRTSKHASTFASGAVVRLPCHGVSVVGEIFLLRVAAPPSGRRVFAVSRGLCARTRHQILHYQGAPPLTGRLLDWLRSGRWYLTNRSFVGFKLWQVGHGTARPLATQYYYYKKHRRGICKTAITMPLRIIFFYNMIEFYIICSNLVPLNL